MFLNGIGKLSIKGVTDIAGITPSAETSNPSDSKHPLLRSKGFVWMGTSAHAGTFRLF